ncbi:MAG TPA: tetratricopeptide repeat protein [Longimicrobiaceae bacterium]|nr:tetratricopeptide repeat protein [Longimicrobiaceae bacterium]
MARLYHERALLLMRQGRLRNAVGELIEGLRESPGDSYLHALLAICHSDLGQHEEARREAREAVGLAPDFAYAHYAHGLVLMAAGWEAEAEEAAREAVRLDPHYPPYQAGLAYILLRRLRWSEALEAADRGLGIDPYDAECANYRARALRELGRGEEALATLRRSLAHDPENPDTHTTLGWTLLRRRAPRRAAEHFREALRLDPRFDQARQGFLEALRARHPLHAAIQSALLSLKDIPAWLAWGLLYFSVAAFAQAATDGVPRGASLTFLAVLVAFSLVRILASWTSEPLLDLLLLLDPEGRRVLARRQRVGAALMGGAFLLAGAAWMAVVVSVLLLPVPAPGEAIDPAAVSLTAALAATGLLIPLGVTLGVPASVPRAALGALTASLYACAATLVAATLRPGLEHWYETLFLVIGGGVLVSAPAGRLLARRAG